MLVAHPVPRGATVLATPAVTAPVLPNGGEITIRLRSEEEEAFEAAAEEVQEVTSAGTNPDAPPFYPKAPTAVDLEDHDDKENNNTNLNKVRQPSVMVWNSFFPSGKEFPLRQTQPPVYFHTQVSAGPNDGESVEEPLLNGEVELQQ